MTLEKNKAMSEVERLVFLGTRSHLSARVLDTLLQQRRNIVAVGVAGAGHGFTALTPPASKVSELPMMPSFVEHGIVEIAWQQGITVWEVGRLTEAALEAVRMLRPTAMVVACWPRLLPKLALEMPRWGVLNIHPSLLPEFRGPAPVFWQLRAGLRQIGVTVHQMNHEFDKGPILKQAPLSLPEGASGKTIDEMVGEIGGRLVTEALDGLERGTLTPQGQVEGGGSHQGWPTEADFELLTEWSAEHAWNFMRGTAEWGVPFTIRTAGGMLIISEALSFDAGGVLPKAVVFEGDRIGVQFSTGVIWMRALRH